jgi:hypothetical protein
MAGRGFSILIVFGVALSCIAVPSARADDVYAWIVGARTGWWAGGDTLLFEGDGETSMPLCTAECIGFDCLVDRCFAFSKVSGVDLETCTWTTTGDSYCATVDGCFWMGLGETYGERCWDCDDNHNYCGSLWRVLAFGGGPGDGGEPNFGCWSVQLLCEQDDPADCHAQGAEDRCDE